MSARRRLESPVDDFDAVFRAIFRERRGEPRPPRSLRVALEMGLVPPQYQKQAKAILDGYTRKPKTALPARSLYNDPGWDNVIRALEEDR